MIYPYVPDGEVLTSYLLDRSRLSIIQGPIQSGTSTCSCHKIWMMANEQAPDGDGVRRTKWIVTRDTYKELRETTIATWLTWFPESEWGPLLRSEPAYHTLNRPHASGDGTTVECVVCFLALPDTDTAVKVLASHEITGFFRNEGQFCEQGIITELLSRCGRWPSQRNGPGATWFGGFIDMNAPMEGHWIPYMRGDFPIPPEWSDVAKARMEKPDDWVFFTQPAGLIEKRVNGKLIYLPNPKAENQKHTTQSYMEMVQNNPDPVWISARIMNRSSLARSGQPVYPDFSESEHVLPFDEKPVPEATIIVGLDFGRQPAAAFCQCINGRWVTFSEIIGENESAEIFAPKVKRHLGQKYPGFTTAFYGDPRGADGGQNSEITAYDIFRAHGMVVIPATSDNNPEMRRSAVGAVLNRRNGFFVNPSCLVVKQGLAGGYHYPKNKGTGLYAEKPQKNRFSHVVEALENAILGGGEGDALIIPFRSPSQKHSAKPYRHKVSLRGR